jgi:hypothetical protein
MLKRVTIQRTGPADCIEMTEGLGSLHFPSFSMLLFSSLGCRIRNYCYVFDCPSHIMFSLKRVYVASESEHVAIFNLREPGSDCSQGGVTSDVLGHIHWMRCPCSRTEIRGVMK